jgi:hypothetical protein
LLDVSSEDSGQLNSIEELSRIDRRWDRHLRPRPGQECLALGIFRGPQRPTPSGFVRQRHPSLLIGHEQSKKFKDAAIYQMDFRFLRGNAVMRGRRSFLLKAFGLGHKIFCHRALVIRVSDPFAGMRGCSPSLHPLHLKEVRHNAMSWGFLGALRSRAPSQIRRRSSCPD